ncbi:MAG: 5-(carboxyamino)imidazole ribonucleotide synthase [Gammaproteobacteria bacterium]|nr:5-(carboxyamino)imidazole ribonucleotide synthase [Gammaproteobacteria bacterium]
MTSKVEPGQWLGVLGGGQLGRMFAQAAQSLGYRVAVYEPAEHCPAGDVADHHFAAAYDNWEQLSAFCERCAAVTVEFENVPPQALEFVAERTRLAPNASAFATARSRRNEKTLFTSLGVDPVPWRYTESPSDIRDAYAELGPDVVLKTNEFGYDGKGQWRIASIDSLENAVSAIGNTPCVMEKRIDLDREFSVVLARADNGDVATFDVVENVHVSGILHTSTVPSCADEAQQDRLVGAARAIAESLDYVGVMAVEFFVAKDGRVYTNEMAPRPHNSGHYTMNGCRSSQFEQQARALAGLPLGSAELHSPTVMINLLGDAWSPVLPLKRLLSQPGVNVHLYGKADAKPGRKMGHINVTAPSAEKVGRLAEYSIEVLGVGATHQG